MKPFNPLWYKAPSVIGSGLMILSLAVFLCAPDPHAETWGLSVLAAGAVLAVCAMALILLHVDLTHRQLKKEVEEDQTPREPRVYDEIANFATYTIKGTSEVTVDRVPETKPQFEPEEMRQKSEAVRSGMLEKHAELAETIEQAIRENNFALAASLRTQIWALEEEGLALKSDFPRYGKGAS